ncbi:hypothetical protein CsSME_00006352 [Camellia sinensis var. sinensis]
MEMLMQESVVFELRWRSTAPFIGKTGGLHLLGRAEIPWKTVSETLEMEIEKWAVRVPKSRRVYEDIKPPAVQVAMKLKVSTVKEAMSVPVLMPMTMRKRRNNQRMINSDECGCMDAISSIPLHLNLATVIETRSSLFSPQGGLHELSLLNMEGCPVTTACLDSLAGSLLPFLLL